MVEVSQALNRLSLERNLSQASRPKKKFLTVSWKVWIHDFHRYYFSYAFERRFSQVPWFEALFLPRKRVHSLSLPCKKILVIIKVFFTSSKYPWWMATRHLIHWAATWRECVTVTSLLALGREVNLQFWRTASAPGHGPGRRNQRLFA